MGSERWFTGDVHPYYYYWDGTQLWYVNKLAETVQGNLRRACVFNRPEQLANWGWREIPYPFDDEALQVAAGL